MKKICFITTGDIKSIATSKRALGLANPLANLGWDVSIIMEDTEENHHRCELECDARIEVLFFPHCGCRQEWKYKNKYIKQIDPDFLYICAFVTRNIVGIGHRSKKLVEHSELQSGIPDVKGMKRFMTYGYEFYSIMYADGLLNASKYLQDLYKRRAGKVFKSSMPMRYFPYAYNPDVIIIKEKEDLSKRYPEFSNSTNFVFLGTVTRNYGVFTILDAVKELKMKNADFKMLILGKGRHYDEAVAYVRKENLTDCVYIPGFVEEEMISDYFSLATAFISPMNDTVQDWARCPSKMYLYVPYKKPVITCKIGEPYEILKEEGNYYKTGDSHSMAEQMLEIIQGKKRESNIDPDRFSWETRAKELNDWIVQSF